MIFIFNSILQSRCKTPCSCMPLFYWLKAPKEPPKASFVIIFSFSKRTTVSKHFILRSKINKNSTYPMFFPDLIVIHDQSEQSKFHRKKPMIRFFSKRHQNTSVYKKHGALQDSPNWPISGTRRMICSDIIIPPFSKFLKKKF